MPKTQTPTRGYTATKDQLLARLRRIEGQIRGIEGMVQDDRYCIDILTQISAAQAALDKVALGLLDGHAHTCVIGAEPDQQNERTEEMMAAVGRLLRRGCYAARSTVAVRRLAPSLEAGRNRLRPIASRWCCGQMVSMGTPMMFRESAPAGLRARM